MEERKTAFENRKRRRLSAPSSAPLQKSLHTYRNTLVLRIS